MKSAIVIIGLLVAASVPVCSQIPDKEALPSIVSFVAPPYPRAAKDQRIQGTTVTRITVAPDGTVTAATTVSAHPVFEKYVVDALKQWRFKASSQEHTFEVTCRFEFYDEDCKKALTPETLVSAELPTLVRVKTGLQCIETSNSNPKR